MSARFLCSYPNTYEYMGVRYPTIDLGFVCEVEELDALRHCDREIAEVLFVPRDEVDIGSFGFPSAGKIAQRYLEPAK